MAFVSVPFRLAVAGGKGGVGKTTVAANIGAYVADSGVEVLFVDADVDNPNAHMNLGLEVAKLKDITLFAPVIDASKCSRCGACAQSCPEHALLAAPGREPVFFEERCSGCRICRLVCKEGAILEGKKILGHIFSARGGHLQLFGAELKPGEARSPLVVGALMDFVREEAENSNYDIVIVDCPPGAGNTVLRAIREADLVLLVTEPTPFGLSTLKIALELVDKLGLKAGVVVNRADISDQGLTAIRELAAEEGLEILAEIPFDEEAVRASVEGVPLVRASPSSRAGRAMRQLAEGVLGLARNITRERRKKDPQALPPRQPRQPRRGILSAAGGCVPRGWSVRQISPQSSSSAWPRSGTERPRA
ncbi:MAG TPA: cobalamin biosynthesis protein CobQ [Candidatus Bathyarchaeota archaeon]|nr:cobalamin biosynthesis protein CobQ [Candidatus Bathyarchaeota archaeon]HEW89715.1 cobalamin biosynthesis protein CobQ [Candidatus Bathyarchaeota archaeon]